MLPACELILEGKAKPGDTVGLLWREELNHPFTSRITFGAAGKAVSGPCTATRTEGGWRAFATMLLTQRDAQLDGYDPLPFIVTNHVQLPLLLTRNVWRGNPWKKCDFAIGKIVEVNGD